MPIESKSSKHFKKMFAKNIQEQKWFEKGEKVQTGARVRGYAH